MNVNIDLSDLTPTSQETVRGLKCWVIVADGLAVGFINTSTGSDGSPRVNGIVLEQWGENNVRIQGDISMPRSHWEYLFDKDSVYTSIQEAANEVYRLAEPQTA